MRKSKAIEAVIARIQYWQRLLGLSNWKLSVRITNRKAYSISRDYRYQRAIISVGKVGNEPADEYILHELLHIIVGEAARPLGLVADRLTKQEKELFREAEERAIETLLRSIFRIIREVRDGSG